MKQICLIGPVDKRVLAYPLIKVLDLVGKTLVLTDDGVYRRFADNFETEFTWGRTDFIVSPVIAKDELEQRGIKLNSYDYIVFITTNELPEGCDLIVYCHGVDKSMCTEEVLAELENKEYTEVFITNSSVKDKKAIKLDMSKETLSYVCLCEEMKSFEVCKSSGMVKVVSHVFAETLGVSGEDFGKLLARKE